MSARLPLPLCFLHFLSASHNSIWTAARFKNINYMLLKAVWSWGVCNFLIPEKASKNKSPYYQRSLKFSHHFTQKTDKLPLSALCQQDNCSVITCRHRHRASYDSKGIKVHLLPTNTTEKDNFEHTDCSKFCTFKKAFAKHHILTNIHTLAQHGGWSILCVPGVVLSPHSRPVCRTVCPCSGGWCEALFPIRAPRSGSLGWSGLRGFGSLGPSRKSSRRGCPHTAWPPGPPRRWPSLLCCWTHCSDASLN